MAAADLKVQVYAAKDGFRWRMFRGGRIIAESGEAYTRHDHCVRAVTRFKIAVRRVWKWMPQA